MRSSAGAPTRRTLAVDVVTPDGEAIAESTDPADALIKKIARLRSTRSRCS
jgi:hypothetical protein